VTGDGNVGCVLDHDSQKPDAISADVRAMFDGFVPERGDCLIACGWVLAEDLAKLA
jgi:hypothetical protein